MVRVAPPARPPARPVRRIRNEPSDAEDDADRAALALHLTNLLVRALFAHRIGIDDLPMVRVHAAPAVLRRRAPLTR